MNVKLAQKDHRLRWYGLNYELNLLTTLESSIQKGTDNRRAEKASVLFCGVDREAKSIQNK